MNKIFLLLLTALLALGNASSAWAQTNAPFLWEIKGKQATHYLLGSVHMLPAGSQPLPAAFDTVYRKIQAVTFETDLAALSEPQTQLDMLSSASAPEGIKSLIGKPLYKQLVARAKELRVPLDDICDYYKPWYCAMMLEVIGFERAGFRPEYGLDQVFYTRAREDGKNIHWLEEPAQHLQLFTAMPDPLAAEFLTATLNELGSSDQNPQSMFLMWRSNDVATLEKITLEMKAKQPHAYERLLSTRSRAWMRPLQKLLTSPESQLIVVGAAHTAGPDGLLALLRKAGYEITPVPMETAPVAVETVPEKAQPPIPSAPTN